MGKKLQDGIKHFEPTTSYGYVLNVKIKKKKQITVIFKNK